MSKSNISLDPGFHFDEVDPTTSDAVDAATRRLLSVNPSLGALPNGRVATAITRPDLYHVGRCKERTANGINGYDFINSAS